ncbi:MULTISPECIES: hypothetical protein [Hymenobacter]|uniref:hypothetical protein n=1 Tax=Hymenobacter TaxID=89966 RepID=UPI0013792042|nr:MULTISPECIES: hypothetical protein [Hymenobacter]
MKKVLLFTCVASLAFSACNRKSQCPAYSSTKEATRISSTISASAATPAPRQ